MRKNTLDIAKLSLSNFRSKRKEKCVFCDRGIMHKALGVILVLLIPRDGQNY